MNQFERSVRCAEPLARAVWKAVPEDFCVRELADLQFDPKGEHLLFRLIKRDCNTAEATSRVAAHAGVPAMHVGFMGIKDRHAVTEQFISVYLGNKPEPDWTALHEPRFRLEYLGRGARKLRRSEHSGNDFRIRLVNLRALSASDSGGAELLPEQRGRIDSALARIREAGYPNAFGPQRFGRNGDNVAQALAWLQGKRRLRNRQIQGLLLSAVRSAAFNSVLEERIRRNCWSLLISGDHPIAVAGMEPVGQVLAPARRCLVPSGVLPADGRIGTGLRGEIEAVALAELGSVLDALATRNMRTGWRPLVAWCRDLAWQWESSSRLMLSFSLAPGCYASVLIQQIFELETLPRNFADHSEPETDEPD